MATISTDCYTRFAQLQAQMDALTAQMYLNSDPLEKTKCLGQIITLSHELAQAASEWLIDVVNGQCQIHQRQVHFGSYHQLLPK